MMVMNSFNSATMKKVFLFSVVAVFAATTLFSCSKAEEELTPANEEQVVESGTESSAIETLTFAIQGDVATKAILGESGGKKFGQWEDGDKIGSIVAAKTTYGYSTVSAASTPVTFSIYCKGGFTAGNLIDVWYPYTATQSDPTSIPLSIPTDQYVCGGDFDFSAMPMVAEEITVTAEMVDGTEDNTAVDEINFYNLGSLIDFKVFATGSYTTERVLSVTFNGNTALAGNFTTDISAVDITDESTLEISGYSETSVTTHVMPFETVGSSSADALDVHMVVAPGSYSGTVVVVTDAATYTYTISSAKDFERGHVRSFGLQLDKTPAAGFSRVAHVKGSFSFDLSKQSYNSASTSAVNWSHGILTVDAAKAGASTNPNNYLPPTYSSSRFYKNSTLSFSVGALQIEKVEYTATSDSYATAMKNSSWSNATTSAEGTLVTIIPTDGSDDFSATIGATTGGNLLKVYYDNTDYTITKGSETNGTFTVSKSSAKVNTDITLSATPASGYSFVSWSVKDASDNDIEVVGDSFQMPASNVTVNATFAPAASAKTINITTPSHGTVSTSPAGSATAGTTVTITATPDSGYEVESISVVDEDDNDVTVTSNQFIMPSKDVTVTVTFIQLAYEMTADGWGAAYAVKTEQSGSSDNANGMKWNITYGGNNSSLGANNKNLASCVLGDTYAKVGTPMGYDASTTYVTAVISESTMSNIAKVVVTNSAVSGTIDAVSLVYSSDGTTYTQEGSSLTSKTDDKYTFEFTKKPGALYYAVVFKGTASSGKSPLFRIDNVNIKYYAR